MLKIPNKVSSKMVKILKKKSKFPKSPKVLKRTKFSKNDEKFQNYYSTSKPRFTIELGHFKKSQFLRTIQKNYTYELHMYNFWIIFFYKFYEKLRQKVIFEKFLNIFVTES